MYLFKKMSGTRALLIVFLGLSSSIASLAQELNCRVVVDDQRIQTTDRAIFRDMERSFQNFMNTRKWTDDFFEPEERINCNIVITLTGNPAINSYEATAQVQSSRPVYNTGYESLMLNFADRDFIFEYTESQPLDFSPNTFGTNLVSMLAFYAYVVIGIDYDSYAKLGGTPHFQRAFDILNLAQSTSIKGWQQFDSNRNRYWLIENLTNKQVEPFREEFYNYHRLGLDVFLEKPEEARNNVLGLLKKLQEIERLRPNSIIKISFFDSKTDEIINIFKQSTPAQKREAFDICSKIEPSNTDKFREMLSN